jgi:hypothetical protein
VPENSGVTVSQGFNRSPTKKGTERLLQFIKAREKELETIHRELSDEKKLLQTCENAIFNLESTISEAKQILKANENSLASLLDIRSHLNSIELIPETNLKDESGTETLYSEFRSHSMKPSERLSEYIDEQIEGLQADIRILWDKLREIEMELGSWNASKRLLQRAITRLNTHYSEIQSDINAGKDGFRPIWKVPSEVWARVLRYHIQEELNSYLKGTSNNYGMRPPIFSISQVCQAWRYLIHNTPELWTLVYIAPTSVWRKDEHDLVTTSIAKGNNPLTLSTNLCQSFWNNAQHNLRYDRNGSYAPTVPVDESTLFDGKEYTLLIDMYDDNNAFMQRLSYLPVCKPTSLVFSARSSIRYGYIFNYLSRFSAVKSFSLINDHPLSLPTVSFATCLPQLQNLAFHVKTFPQGLQLGSFLTTSLQEIHLRNDEGGSWPNLDNIQLSQLRVLGITFPGSYLLDRLAAKGLRSLTLYGPYDCGLSKVTLSQQSAAIYNQLTHLKFEDWRKPDILNGTLGAVAILSDLNAKMTALQTIVFAGSFVDGAALVSTIETRREGSGGLSSDRSLKEITFRHISGITRAQCERVEDLVKEVNVYM